ALRQIRIEVVLARENTREMDGATESERGAHAEIDGRGIGYRQGARQTEADRTDVRVRRGAENDTVRAEQLGVRRELDVYLEADDGFEGTHSASSRSSAAAAPTR